MPENYHVAACGQMRQDAPVEPGKLEREAVARVAGRPFGNSEIVADVERRQHRSGWNAERLDDEAAQGPGDQRHAEHEPQQRARGLFLLAICRIRSRPTATGEGWAHRAACFLARGCRSSRGGKWLSRHYVRRRWT